MMTGLCFVLAGLAVWFFPQILFMMISGSLILFGMGIMLASWQFRRLRKHSQSQFVNWIVRY